MWKLIERQKYFDLVRNPFHISIAGLEVFLNIRGAIVSGEGNCKLSNINNRSNTGNTNNKVCI